jgi:hypothetical protein
MSGLGELKRVERYHFDKKMKSASTISVACPQGLNSLDKSFSSI